MVSAVDGQVTGGGGVDKFRIKIWETASGTIVYDNNFGADENTEAATALGGGSIVIHTPPKGKNARSTSPAAQPVAEELQLSEGIALDAYPNPMRSMLTVKFANPENAPVAINMLDMTGRTMSIRITELAEGGYVLDTNELTNGFYYLKVRVGNAMQAMKLLKQD